MISKDDEIENQTIHLNINKDDYVLSETPYQELLKMRRLRERFELLSGISNHNNELINRGKTPTGFKLLDSNTL